MKYIVGCVMVLLSTVSYSLELKSRDDTEALSEKIVKLFVDKKFKSGLALAKPHWPLPEVEIDGLANQIDTQWPIVDQRFGQSTGYELVRVEKIGESFIRYYYLHKFQNHAIYWQMTFYKPKDSWKVNGIQFLDSLDILYEIEG